MQRVGSRPPGRLARQVEMCTTMPDAPSVPRTLAPVPTLRIGPIAVWPPVVLAPMAGVTNGPFRAVCRAHGAGLYVSEMVSARGLVEGHDRSRSLTGSVPTSPAQRSAVRDRSGHDRRGRPAPRLRARRATHRSELRLSRAEGDAARGRCGVAGPSSAAAIRRRRSGTGRRPMCRSR